MAKAKVTLVDAVPVGDGSTDYTVLIDYVDPSLRDETQVYRWTCANKPELRAKLDALADHYEAQVVAKGRAPAPDAVPAVVTRGGKARAFERDLLDQPVAAK